VAPPSTPPTPTPEPTSEEAPAPTTSAESAGSEAAGAAKDGNGQAAKQSKPSNDKGAGTSLYDLVKRGEATMPTSPSTPTASKPAAPTPAPAPATPAPSTPAPSTPAPSAPKGKVKIPSTANVRVDIPSGLQAALDLDPRMQPWANSVIQVIDSCYTKELKSNASAAGVIAVRITMHSESRPDADVKSLPPALSGVVACATGGLMRTKMPLFTGKEGEKHDVNIRFTP